MRAIFVCPALCSNAIFYHLYQNDCNQQFLPYWRYDTAQKAMCLHLKLQMSTTWVSRPPFSNVADKRLLWWQFTSCLPEFVTHKITQIVLIDYKRAPRSWGVTQEDYLVFLNGNTFNNRVLSINSVNASDGSCSLWIISGFEKRIPFWKLPLSTDLSYFQR